MGVTNFQELHQTGEVFQHFLPTSHAVNFRQVNHKGPRLFNNGKTVTGKKIVVDGIN